MDISAFSAHHAAAYRILDPMPWDRLVGPMTAAEDALARLDERLSKSAIRDGLASRMDFADACASQWLDGELVHVEDLVLHDAMMDIRAPTAELVRAHETLRARRRIANAKPGWALTAGGLDALRGRATVADDTPADQRIAIDHDWLDDDDEWEKTLAAVDAVVERSNRLLEGRPDARPDGQDRPSLVYDLDWDEDARLAEWRAVMASLSSAPATLAAAVALDAWNQIEPLQSQAWLGRLLAVDLLRSRLKTRAHLSCLSLGLKAVPQQMRWKKDPIVRLEVTLQGLAEAATAGLKEHDRLVVASAMLQRRIEGRRSNSKLPLLRDLAVKSPIVTASLIASRLGVSQRAALMLAQDLGLRETTGRKRYRAWTAA